MSILARKQFIEDLIKEYCLENVGDCQTLAALFWRTHPALEAEYIELAGKLSVRGIGLKIHNEMRAAAANEDERDTNIEQLDLPGIPHARLSPLVEVGDGDWRRSLDVSMTEQVIHSERMEEKLHKKAQYQKRKGVEQREASEAMERRVPGSSVMPRREVIEVWRDIGLFDDDAAPAHTTAT